MSLVIAYGVMQGACSLLLQGMALAEMVLQESLGLEKAPGPRSAGQKIIIVQDVTQW